MWKGVERAGDPISGSHLLEEEPEQRGMIPIEETSRVMQDQVILNAMRDTQLKNAFDPALSTYKLFP